MDANREKFLKEQLSAYLDGELSEEERAEVQAWLDEYADTRALVDELRATVEALGALPRAEASGELLEGLRSRLERRALLDEPSEFAGEGTPVRMFSVGRWLSAAAVLALSGVALYFTWSNQEPGRIERDQLARLDERESVVPVLSEESERSDELVPRTIGQEEIPRRLTRRLEKTDGLDDDADAMVHAKPAAPVAPGFAVEGLIAAKAEEETKETLPSGEEPALVAAPVADTITGGAGVRAVPAETPGGPAGDTEGMVIRHDLSLGGDRTALTATEDEFMAEAPAVSSDFDTHLFDTQLGAVRDAPAPDVELKVVELVYADEADVRETLEMLDARFAKKAPTRKRAAVARSQPAEANDYARVGGAGRFSYGYAVSGKDVRKQTTTAPAGEAVTTLTLTLPDQLTFDDMMDTLYRAERRPTQSRILDEDDTPKDKGYRAMRAEDESFDVTGDLYVAGEPTTQPAVDTEEMWDFAQPESEGEGRPEADDARKWYALDRSAKLGQSLQRAETQPAAAPPTSQPAANQAVTLSSTISSGEDRDAVAPLDSLVVQAQRSAPSNRLRLYVYIDPSGDTPTTRPATSQPTTQPVTTQPTSAPANP